MNDINLDHQKESDIELSFSESCEENYENYRRQSLPEGYTPYRETAQVAEAVYDQYDPDYAADETPDQEAQSCSCTRKKSCCKIGWLSKLLHRSGHFKDSIE